jgi:predicted metalloprotease with PDZ domain
MMPVWSPGFYRVENYANKLDQFKARAPDGTELAVEQPRKNRWKFPTRGAERVTVSYRLLGNARSVTQNWVGEDFAALTGPATFVTLVEPGPRPHIVQLTLPPEWKKTVTGLEQASGQDEHTYRAASYDVLADSPIMAGNPAISEFTVAGVRHTVAAFGDLSAWDGEKNAAVIEKLVQEHVRFWGKLPFSNYVFLLALKQGGGGLEHSNSTLITMSPSALRSERSRISWLALICHEYFHAFNVKRLRPVELGPFDYENQPRTSGLWVAEGLTTYYGELLVCRAGLSQPDHFLGQLSGHIEQLQNTAGRLVQSLERASLDVWSSSMSGVGGGAKTVSYYVKGPVVGFLLDARIRRLTGGERSLDDVMRLAYSRHSGDRGFTAEGFRQCAEEVAGADLKDWFRQHIESAFELDYTEALDWFGLEFTTPDPQKPEKKWRLAVRPDASAEQKSRLARWSGTAAVSPP